MKNILHIRYHLRIFQQLQKFGIEIGKLWFLKVNFLCQKSGESFQKKLIEEYEIRSTNCINTLCLLCIIFEAHFLQKLNQNFKP